MIEFRQFKAIKRRVQKKLHRIAISKTRKLSQQKRLKDKPVSFTSAMGRWFFYEDGRLTNRAINEFDRAFEVMGYGCIPIVRIECLNGKIVNISEDW